MMKEKTRFKLHKVKKQWVAIAVTSLALAAILSGAHLTQAEEQSGGGTDSKPRLTATVQESSEQPITEAPAADSSVENNSANAVKSSETAEAAEVSDGGRASQTEAVTNQTNSGEHHPAEKATAVSGEAQSVQNAPSENAAQQETAKTEPATAAENNNAAPTNSFFEKDGKWYYKKADGQLATGWQTIDGKQLYFNQDGVRSKEKFMWRQGIKSFIILFS